MGSNLLWVYIEQSRFSFFALYLPVQEISRRFTLKERSCAPPPFFTRARDIIWGRISRRVGFNLRAFHLTIPLSLSPLYPSISLSLPLFPSLYPSLSLLLSLPLSLSLISPSLSISFLLPFFLSLSFSLSSLYHSLWRI